MIHGDDDQIVPIAAAGEKTAKIVKNATLKVYPGAPHGLAETEADKFNADVLNSSSRNFGSKSGRDGERNSSCRFRFCDRDDISK